MQRNPGVNTIEEELLHALLAVGAITRDHFDTPQTCQFQRTARTDKGVHAARQLVSLKMTADDPDIVAKLNTRLPPAIRAFWFTRVTKLFNCKLQCSGRRYEYLAPSYAFAAKVRSRS